MIERARAPEPTVSTSTAGTWVCPASTMSTSASTRACSNPSPPARRLQVVRARRVVHRHDPDGPRRGVRERGADVLGLPLGDPPRLPPPARHGAQPLDAHGAQVEDRVEVPGHLRAVLAVRGGHPVQRVREGHVVIADHDHRRPRELVDDLLGADELVGPRPHREVAGHDGGGHLGIVQVLGQPVERHLVVGADMDVRHVRDAQGGAVRSCHTILQWCLGPAGYGDRHRRAQGWRVVCSCAIRGA